MFRMKPIKKKNFVWKIIIIRRESDVTNFTYGFKIGPKQEKYVKKIELILIIPATRT